MPMRLEPRDEALQGCLVADAQPHMTDSRGRVRRQLERVPFVIAPARGDTPNRPSAPALMKADHRREERQALFGLRREQLDVAEMRDVSETGK